MKTSLEKILSLLERIDNSYKDYMLLTEGGDSRLNVVNRIIDQVFSNYFNPDEKVSGSEYYVNGNPDTTWRKYLIYNLRHTFGLMQNSDVKYLPTVARLAYSDDVKFDITNDNSEKIRTLQRIIALFKKDDNLFQEVKNNDNITFSVLAERFKESFDAEDRADSEEANKVEGGNSEYTIKLVPDFETASYYGKFSCSDSRLCYTEKESTWNDYTGNGVNTVYVCLRNGWENIPEKETEGFPYDLYGTSMIFVFVGPNNNLVTSNCRWNHHGCDNYDVDHMFTKTTLSKTIGMPFDSVFKGREVSESDICAAIEKGNYDFLGSIAVGDFVIPSGVTKIGDYAFNYCESLSSIVIPNSVTSIGDYAFNSCTSLSSIVIPNSVTSIGNYTFSSCTSLSSIVIPNSVTSIGEAAFAGCRLLRSIEIPNSVTSIGDYAFSSCKSLRSITIPDSVTYIGNNAFYYCKSLSNITIPNSVTSIGDYAFYFCTSLRSITIPDSVTYIGNNAFDGCGGLTSITIPNSVTSIGNWAFYGCRSLVIYTKKRFTAYLVADSGFTGTIKIIN